MTVPSTQPMRPTLLSSCARAATAEELRYRIDRPIRPRRGARVVALDEVAGRVVRDAAAHPWNAARFYEHAPASFGSELDDADVVVMVAAVGGNGETAAAIGRACASRGIMVAGIILGETRDVRDVVSALRPHAQVLMVTSDAQDLSEVLTALRA